MSVPFTLSVTLSSILYTVFFTVLTVVAIIAFAVLFVKFSQPITQDENTEVAVKPINAGGMLAIIIVIGLLLRLVFTFVVRGERGLFNEISSFIAYVNQNGFISDYYSAFSVGNVYPLNYLMFSFTGLLSNAFGVSVISEIMPLFTKLPSILFDLGTAIVLFIATKKYTNEKCALIVSAFYCVFPVSVFASSVWGSTLSILAFFLVLCGAFIANKNVVGAIIAYSLALLTSSTAIYVFPVIAVYVIYTLVKACVYVHKNKPMTLKNVISCSSASAVFTVPLTIVLSIAVCYLITLPSIIGSIGANFFTYIYTFYLSPIVKIRFFGTNSLGIFNVFTRNGAVLDSSFPIIIFSILFALIITGVVLLTYLSKRNRANLIYTIAYALLTLSVYFVGFSELSLVSILPIMILAFVLIRDKRILQVTLLLFTAVIFNASFTFIKGNYFNADASIIEINTLLKSGGYMAVNIICSCIAVICHVYATLILLDVSLSGKRKLFGDSAKTSDVIKNMFVFWK